jgi:eukaryotic-like serine/threonine-protein kinase
VRRVKIVEAAMFAIVVGAVLTGCKHRRWHAAKPSPIDLTMVSIPGGRFPMGSDDGDSDEKPVHFVTLDSFRMQRTLVTVAEYLACESKGACTSTPEKPYCNEHIEGRAAHPMNCVTWHQASTFCSWAVARLPTEAEWEYAARGTDGRRYPWGNNRPAQQLCWDGKTSDLGMMKRRSTCSVESHPSGASPFGLLDMAGNVWQWTSDLASKDYDERRTGPKRIVRGGTWYGFDARDVRATLRFREREDIEDYGTGFRCVR